MLLRRYHKKAVEAVNEVSADKAIDDMTVAELKEYAAAHDIEIGEAAKKADILAATKNA